MSSEDFQQKCKDLQLLLLREDVIGSLDCHQSFLTGQFVTDPYAREKLEDWAKGMM